MNFLFETRDSQSGCRGLSHKSITLSGYFGLAVVLPKAVENFDREMLSSKISQNNTGSYAQLIEATSDLIVSCFNASHSSLNASSVQGSFERYTTMEVLSIKSMAEISPVLFHPKLAIAVYRSASATGVFSVVMVGIIMSPLLSKYESSFNLYDSLYNLTCLNPVSII